jgi:hypothetical protein
VRSHAAANERLFSHAPQARPPSVGSFASERFAIRVHYAEAVLETRAAEVLPIVEDAWALLVDELGFPEPLPDHGEGGDERVDIYVGLVSPALAITVAGANVSPEGGPRRSYAYVVLDHTIRLADMPVFVHHEVAHLVQFGIDLDATPMFAEASAVAHERFALPERTSWAQDLEDFQAWPTAPLFSNGIDLFPFTNTRLLYEFGASLFLLYLEQEHGELDGTLLRRLWERTGAPEATSDWLVALAAEVPVPLEDLVLDFASWRALVGGWAVADDGLVGAERLGSNNRLFAKQLAPAVLDGRALPLEGRDRLFQLGCATFQVETLSQPLPLRVRVRSSGGDDDEAPRPLGLAWVIGDPSRGVARRGRHAEVGEELIVEATLGPRETGLFSVCDLGPADARDLPSATPAEVRFLRTDVDFPDAGPEASDAGPPDGGSLDDEPPDCSCQSTPVRKAGNSKAPFAAARPWAMGVLSLTGLLMLLIRGRRLSKRRSLYRQDSERRVG